jgi:hypothetical protein
MRRFKIRVDVPRTGPRRSPRPAAPIATAERLAVGALAFGLALWPALSGGGYDVVVRQELGLAVWWGLALALGFGLLPRARLAPEARVAAAGLAALAALIALGLIDAESPGAAEDELARVIGYGGILAAAWLGLGPRTWRAAAIGLGLAAVAVSLIAVVWRLDLLGDLGADPALVARRLAYPLGYWNALAAWAAGAFAIALAWSAHVRHPWGRSLALAMLPVCGLALYLTFSRGGLGALAIGVAVAMAAAGNRLTTLVHAAAGLAATGVVVLVVRGADEIVRGTGDEGAWTVALALLVAAAACAGVGTATRMARLDRRRAAGAGGVGAAAAVAAVVVILGAGVAIALGGDDTVAAGAEEAAADPAARLVDLDDGRGAIWESALAAFASDPVSGTGAGSFELWWAQDPDATAGLRDAHSLYVETLGELGLPGFVALAIFVVALGVGAVRARQTLVRSGDLGAAAGLMGAGAAFALHAGIDWLWEFPALFVLGVGGPAVLVAARADRLRPGGRLRRRRLVLIAVAVLAGVTQVPGIVSDNRLRAALAASEAGFGERALELAADAQRAEPWAAGPRALQAELHLDAGDSAAARTSALAAIEREPTWWRHRLVLARIELAAGDREAARAAMADVARLRPAVAAQVEEALPGRPR